MVYKINEVLTYYVIQTDEDGRLIDRWGFHSSHAAELFMAECEEADQYGIIT